MNSPEISNPADIDPVVKRRYFTKLALRNVVSMRPHRAAGQLNRFKQVEGKDKSQRWGDPTEHCLVEAAGSEVLSKMLKLSESDTKAFISAALVHDASKRQEIEAQNRAKEAGKPTPEELTKELDRINDLEAVKSKQRLIYAGIDPLAVHLTETVAHHSIGQFAYLDNDNVMHLREGVPVVDMAMHYLDDITMKTDIVSLSDRMDFLDARGVPGGQYAYNEEGREKWGGRTYFEAQRECSTLVEAHLAGIAGVEDPTTLPDVINTGLVELITAA